MSISNQNITLIAFFFKNFFLPADCKLLSFSDKEIDHLSEKFSIRFKKTGSEYLCYYSILPGKSGVGGTKFFAFCYMLNNLGFKLATEESFDVQLKRHLENIK